MDLDGDLARAAEAASAFAAEGERLDAVLAAEPSSGERVYLVSYAGEGGRSWLVLDARGEPTVPSQILTPLEREALRARPDA